MTTDTGKEIGTWCFVKGLHASNVSKYSWFGQSVSVTLAFSLHGLGFLDLIHGFVIYPRAYGLVDFVMFGHIDLYILSRQSQGLNLMENN